MKNLIQKLPAPSLDRLDRLIENRTVYTANDFELNIFDTFETVENFKLSFGDASLVSMIAGEKKMSLNADNPFRFVPGQSVWVSENSKLNIDFPKASHDNPSQCTVLLLNEAKISKVLDYLNEFKPKTLGAKNWTVAKLEKHFENSSELSWLLNRFFQLCLSSNLHKDALAHLQLQEILIRIMQTQELLAVEMNDESNSTPIQFLKKYIESNLSEKITLQSLSEKVYMSSSTLYREFKKELGISPMEFVQNLRIKEAEKLLLEGMSVKDVAQEVGIYDDNYFIRMFKKHNGVTPGSFVLP